MIELFPNDGWLDSLIPESEIDGQSGMVMTVGNLPRLLSGVCLYDAYGRPLFYFCNLCTIEYVRRTLSLHIYAPGSLRLELAMRIHRGFTAHILPVKLKEKVLALNKTVLSESGDFDALGLIPERGKVVRAPVLKGSFLALECEADLTRVPVYGHSFCGTAKRLVVDESCRREFNHMFRKHGYFSAALSDCDWFPDDFGFDLSPLVF